MLIQNRAEHLKYMMSQTDSEGEKKHVRKIWLHIVHCLLSNVEKFSSVLHKFKNQTVNNYTNDIAILSSNAVFGTSHSTYLNCGVICLNRIKILTTQLFDSSDGTCSHIAMNRMANSKLHERDYYDYSLKR